MAKRTPNGGKIAAITPKAADALKIIVGEHRLRILHLLKEGPKSVIELERHLGLRQPRISQELSVLRKGHFVHDKNEGRNRIYSLHHDNLKEVVALLSSLVE